MERELREKFIELWKIYFDGSELPIAFYYTNQEASAELVSPPSEHQCVIGVLSRVRKGTPLCFDSNSMGCGGGKRYLGFGEEIMPDFEYFLSCGIPGKVEGERYKKSPEMVKEIMKQMPEFKAPARYIVFKRWDRLEEADNPDVVIFFGKADVLSGLFTLANFDEIEPNGVIAPFCSGCASIVYHPYLEKDSERPRGVLGMFDVSARPYVPKDILTISLTINKFERMVENMNETFLITQSWKKVSKRIRPR